MLLLMHGFSGIVLKTMMLILQLCTVILTGTSPHTYTEEDEVREGENTIRVRAQCPGQLNDRPTQDLSVSK